MQYDTMAGLGASTIGSLTVYDFPSTTANVVRNYSAGEEIMAVSMAGTWLRVYTDDSVGFVQTTSAQLSPVLEKARRKWDDPMLAKVTDENHAAVVEIHSVPDVNASVISRCFPGEFLQVARLGTDWCMVRMPVPIGVQYGFVPLDNLMPLGEL